MQRGCCLGAAGAGFWGADACRLLRIEAPPPPLATATAPRRSGGCAEADLGSRAGPGGAGGFVWEPGWLRLRGPGGMPGCGRGWGSPPWGRDEAAPGVPGELRAPVCFCRGFLGRLL